MRALLSCEMMLAVGVPAPDFSLPTLVGGTIRLSEWTADSPVLLAFFKVTCPTCQFAAPYLGRMASNGRVRFLGISQDNKEKTERFNQTYGIPFDTVIDPADARYAVSSAYGITNVPTLFLVEAGGRQISLAGHGFSRADFQKIADRAGVPAFAAGEKIPEFKPG